ncbi:MAG: hypothetical protein WDZ31_02855 [Phycisphaeraceae bacterium]
MADMSGSRLSTVGNNVYTVLLAVAFVALLLGVGFVWYRYAELFETANPFSVSQTTLEAARLAFLA